MTAIGLREIKAFVDRQLRPDQVTTAHVAGYRFYRELRPRSRPPAVLEVIARAPSPWAIRMTLEDASRFMRADRRTRERWRRAARARLATLQGEVLAPVELDRPRFPWEAR